MDLTTREGFLRFALTTAGTAAVVGMITSIIIPWFYDRLVGGTWDDVDKKLKSDIMLALNFIVPLFATIGLGMIGTNDMWFALTVGFLVSFPQYASNQAIHKTIKGLGLKNE